ncbi:MAG: acyltransferase [Clostridia bacterium]|nr:acyltransferase [Clostridia bacterium]
MMMVIRNKYLRFTNPVGYAKRIGVNFPDGGLFVYGKIDWGTEPWIITIGSNVHLTDGVKFLTHDGGTLLYRNIVPDLEITKPITIGNNVYIGNNVILLPGVNVGDNVVIGAGAVVSKDIPSNSVAVGVPAKVIKSADEYLEKIKKESLHLGHLKGQEKDKALMEHYHYKGNSKGIYY